VKFTHFLKSTLTIFIGFSAFLPLGITAAALDLFFEILCRLLGVHLFAPIFQFAEKAVWFEFTDFLCLFLS
jgi:hypothetical protein